jgi:hypothetical protein
MAYQSKFRFLFHAYLAFFSNKQELACKEIDTACFHSVSLQNPLRISIRNATNKRIITLSAKRQSSESGLFHLFVLRVLCECENNTKYNVMKATCMNAACSSCKRLDDVPFLVKHEFSFFFSKHQVFSLQCVCLLLSLLSYI